MVDSGQLSQSLLCGEVLTRWGGVWVQCMYDLLNKNACPQL